jgi:hypothetical protein
VGSLLLALLCYPAPQAFAALIGLSGADTYIYRLAGAAALGYAVALAIGARGAPLRALRPVVAATWTFAAMTFFTAYAELASGEHTGTALLVLIVSVVVAWSTGKLLVAIGHGEGGARDVASWYALVLVVATLAAAFFGVAPLFAEQFAAIFGYTGKDLIVYRLAAAATAGYAVMGVFELRDLRWDDIWLATLMGLVFNGLAFAASLAELASGSVTLLAVLVGAASGAFTLGFALALVRRGG